MTLENLKIIIEEAIDELKLEDRYLLEHNVNERSISHKLACYIGKRINGWDVDAEYNRNMDDQKRLSSTDRYGVMPDIIIHRRGYNNDTRVENNNLLVIEIKKIPTEKQKKSDILKLKQFIENPPYFYKFGAFITFDGSDIAWFSRE